MKNKFVILLVLFTCIFLLAEDKTLTFATNPWPPFADDVSQNKGFAVEVVKEAFKTQGYITEVKFYPWARAMLEAKKLRCDILINAWKNEERLDNYVFSNPYTRSKIVFIKRYDDPFEYNEFNNLEGKRIGVGRGWGFNKKFWTTEKFKRYLVTDFETNLRKLLHKRIDLTVEDEDVAKATIAKKFGQHKYKFKLVKKPLANAFLHIAVSKEHENKEEIIKAFNAGLEQIKKNKTYYKLVKKYGVKGLP